MIDEERITKDTLCETNKFFYEMYMAVNTHNSLIDFAQTDISDIFKIVKFNFKEVSELVKKIYEIKMDLPLKEIEHGLTFIVENNTVLEKVIDSSEKAKSLLYIALALLDLYRSKESYLHIGKSLHYFYNYAFSIKNYFGTPGEVSKMIDEEFECIDVKDKYRYLLFSTLYIIDRMECYPEEKVIEEVCEYLKTVNTNNLSKYNLNNNINLPIITYCMKHKMNVDGFTDKIENKLKEDGFERITLDRTILNRQKNMLAESMNHICSVYEEIKDDKEVIHDVIRSYIEKAMSDYIHN